MSPKNISSTERSATSTGSSKSRSNNHDGRKSKVATSMRNMVDDDFDYLGSLTAGNSSKTSSRSMARASTRKKTPTSYGKKVTNKDRLNIPKASKPRSIIIRSKSMEENPPESKRSLLRRWKSIDKAARPASPGMLRARSKSPGPMKNRISSPTSSKNTSTSPKSTGRLKKKETSAELSEENTKSTRSTKKRLKSTGKLKNRSDSPGRLKKRSESPGRLKKRSESPGRLKKRSESPGGLKKRSDSQGTLRKNARSRRHPENDDGDGPVRRASRSSSNVPPRKPERARSSDRNRSKSTKPSRSARSTQESNKSYSSMQDRLSRHKVKRNKSMDAVMAHQGRKNSQQADDDDEDRRPPRRAESMMLNREMGRRSKSNSLSNLIQYKEEEIHSTSYFASNHVLINRERMKRGLRPLTRNVAMDELARKSAEAMASTCGLSALPTTYVGNVLRGETIRSIHRSTMLQKNGRERQNLLNPYFQDFGVGTNKGDDGMLYMCQLFSERLELALTDTIKADEAQKD